MLTHGQFGKDGWPPWGPWTPTHQVPTYCGWASEILRQLIDGLPSGKHAQNYRKSPFFMGKSTISIAIFNSYVKLPEGRWFIQWFLGSQPSWNGGLSDFAGSTVWKVFSPDFTSHVGFFRGEINHRMVAGGIRKQRHFETFCIHWFWQGMILSGWWFGTCGLLFHILGRIIPTDELHHFSEG